MTNKESARDPLSLYWGLARRNPRLFDNPSRDGFVILLDEAAIRRVETEAASKLRQERLPAEWGQVGVVFEDQYLLILRDAVCFPDGQTGTYIRIVDRKEGSRGVVALPMYEGKVVLLRHFRHATRAWHIEIPRGFGSAGLSSEESARKELLEETGGVVSRLVPLGRLHVNTGISSECVDLFLAELSSIGQPDAHEGIAEVMVVETSEFELLIRGVEITDSFTIAAYSRAKLSGLL